MSDETRITPQHRITSRIIDALESGVVPWEKPWVTGTPRNAASGRRYSGANVLVLELTALERGYVSPGWVTYKQAQQHGGHVRQAEKGTMVIWFERRPVRSAVHATPSTDDPEEEIEHPSIFLARPHWVFNLEQCAGLDALRENLGGRRSFHPMVACDHVLMSSGASISHGGDQAYYDRATDSVTLPHPSRFVAATAYYATAFHELTHWTGAAHRLGRETGKRFGDPAYAFEELVAELGASFIAARCGIEHVSQAAAYIGSWLRVLKSSNQALFTAASLAHAAADLLCPQIGQDGTSEPAGLTDASCEVATSAGL